MFVADIPVTRRGFGLFAGSSAITLVLGGTVMTVVISGRDPEPAARTVASFGTVELLRAGRTARIKESPSGPDADSASSHHFAPAVSAAPQAARRQPANHTWGDVIVLELRVHNRTDRPVLLSAGQLRLRVDSQEPGGGPTITPFNSAWKAGALTANAAQTLWISYLAPTAAESFVAEFSDPQLDNPLLLALPPFGTEVL